MYIYILYLYVLNILIIRFISYYIRLPLKWTKQCHSQAARILLGAPLANALNIQSNWFCWIYLSFTFTMMAIISWVIAPFVTSNGNYAKHLRYILRKQVEVVLNKYTDGQEHGSFSSNSGGCPILS